MSELRYRPFALLMLVLYLGACTSWRPSTVSPRQLIEEEQPGAVRVTTTDGTRVLLREPSIEADSISYVSLDLAAAPPGGIAGQVRTEGLKIPLSQVSEIDWDVLAWGRL